MTKQEIQDAIKLAEIWIGHDGLFIGKIRTKGLKVLINAAKEYLRGEG